MRHVRGITKMGEDLQVELHEGGKTRCHARPDVGFLEHCLHGTTLPKAHFWWTSLGRIEIEERPPSVSVASHVSKKYPGYIGPKLDFLTAGSPHLSVLSKGQEENGVICESSPKGPAP